MSWLLAILFVLVVLGVAVLVWLWMAALAARGVWRAGTRAWQWSRQYDVELVINRSLVYTLVVVCLAVVYLGGVVLLQALLQPLTQGSEPAVAGTTVAVTALFGPVCNRVQTEVNRRFYRRRYDAARTLEAFAVRLQHEVSLDAMSRDLRDVVRHTMQPAHVSLWLRPPHTGTPK